MYSTQKIQPATEIYAKYPLNNKNTHDFDFVM